MPVPPPCHGGSAEPAERLAAPERAQELLREAQADGWPRIGVSRADLATVRRWGDGTLSPLRGPMNGEAFRLALNEERVLADGKPYAWTIPLSLPAADDERAALRPGRPALLVDAAGEPVAALDVEDVFPWNKDSCNAKVYGTARTDHPGVRLALGDPRRWLVGGTIHVFPWERDESTLAGRYSLSPREIRARLKEKGWDAAIAFQTRNPLHRAHEYAMVAAAERLLAQGLNAGVVLHPLVGETKSGDVDAETRMRTYERLIRGRLLGQGDASPGLWERAGRSIADASDLFALDMRMFYAGPREAVMHAIYRQNCGFSHIVIGRRHADAPFDDGSPAWGDLDAQEKFDSLAGELLIEPLKIGPAAYFEELGRVAPIEEGAAKGWKPFEVAGSLVREQLRAGQAPDPRIMRPETSEILVEAFRQREEENAALEAEPQAESDMADNIFPHPEAAKTKTIESLNGHKGAVAWLTGLSGSGKSTLAHAAADALLERGARARLLDGDNLREGLCRGLGFSPEERRENNRRAAEAAKLLAESGLIVLAAFVSPYRDSRAEARRVCEEAGFLEVYAKASLEACERRDPKGLYQKARAGEIPDFTGIGAPYEEPLSPDILIDTEQASIAEGAAMIVAELERREIIPPAPSR